MTKAKLFCGAAALAFAAALAAPTPSLAFHGGGHGGGHMGGAHMGGGMHMNGAMHMNAAAGGTHFAGTAGGARVAGTGTWHGGHTAWNGGGRWHGGHGGFWPGAVAGAVVGGALASSYAYYGGPDYYDDYYGGPDYYYDQGPVVTVAPGGNSIGYCEQRYRSYDPASGTYLGYDGLRHPCP